MLTPAMLFIIGASAFPLAFMLIAPAVRDSIELARIIRRKLDNRGTNV